MSRRATYSITRTSGKDDRTGSSGEKGQIEIFGLAFIVILITIGFFIFVSVRASQEPKNPQKDFTDDKLANDFVLSILHVNIRECPQYTVEDLIVDCGRDKRIMCSTDNSCIALNATVTILLKDTFMEQDMGFRFYSENLPYDDIGSELFNVTYLNCSSDDPKGKRGVAIIRLYPVQRDVYLNMGICH